MTDHTYGITMLYSILDNLSENMGNGRNLGECDYDVEVETKKLKAARDALDFLCQPVVLHAEATTIEQLHTGDYT